MHAHQKPWKPQPAFKPSHLTTNPAEQTNVSLAALRGATSAFASSSTTSLPDVGQLRRKYENTETNASSIQRGRPIDLKTENEEEHVPNRSPVRGRHLSPEDAILAGARSAASNKSHASTAQLERSPSLIAARMVSTSPSPSPARGRSTATPLQTPSPEDSKVVRPALSAAGSLYNKSLTAVSPPHKPYPSQAKENVPNLDLERVPVLSPNSKATNAQTYMKPPPIQASSVPSQAVGSVTTTKATASGINQLKHTDTLPISSSPIAIPMIKPPLPPAPRKGRSIARSPLQADLTGPRSAPGLSREEVINRMADAMVASSLASTRTSSPTKGGLSRPGMKRSESARESHRVGQSATTPALPIPARAPRPMKTTLRKESPEEEEDETKRGRRHLVRKHPNMHHEGDRKRWRDKVTEGERRRYEGVFAANRGLLLRAADTRASPSRLMDPNAESNHVANVVVRDIWERSRLSSHVLEQIYDLVAPNEASTLSREQFVVGLWLIDQKLKGRKLPVKVSESVWDSVRHTHGITIGR